MLSKELKKAKERVLVNLREQRGINGCISVCYSSAKQNPLFNERAFEYLVLIEEIEATHFKISPLRSEDSRKVLIFLPFWAYLTEDFFNNYFNFNGRSNFKKECVGKVE